MARDSPEILQLSCQRKRQDLWQPNPGNGSAYGHAKQIEADQDASEDAMRKWLYLPAAISLISFSVSAQELTQNNISGDSAKVLATRNTSSQPPKPATESPDYSSLPMTSSSLTYGRNRRSRAPFPCGGMARFLCHC